MSDGRRVKQLSFKYRAVKCSNCHNCGLMLRTLPKVKRFFLIVDSNCV